MVIAAIAAIAIIVVFAYSQRNETRKLRGTFGPEYDRVLGQEHANKRRTEAVLRKRMRRIQNLDIRKPRPEASNRFAAEWRSVQEPAGVWRESSGGDTHGGCCGAPARY